MKIQKVIHACDDKDFYLDFWPIVSKIWKVKFGVEPVLLHFGDKSPTTEWGTVIKMKIVEGVPLHTQCQIARYWIPITDLEAIWMTSDIDMLPIARSFFVDGIAGVSDDKWVSLRAELSSEQFPYAYNCCYNIASGKTFKEILDLPESWEEFVNLGFWQGNDYTHAITELDEQMSHWNADEQWASEKLNQHPDQDRIKRIYREGGHSERRIDRLNWQWSPELLRQEFYYDCHCARPYQDFRDDIDAITASILPKTDIGFPAVPYEEYITGDKFKALDTEFVAFLKVEGVLDYLRNSAPKRIIISHNGDLPVDGTYLSYDDKFDQWFGQNVMVDHPKITPIPIGLENDYVANSIEKKQLLHEVAGQDISAECLLYVNHNIETNPTERIKPYQILKQTDGITISDHAGFCSQRQYYENIKAHRFTLSPPGNGIDCHRTWEILYLGRIPVVKRAGRLEELYEGLPVVFVDDYDQITEEFLMNSFSNLLKQDFAFEKLTFSYWAGLIQKNTPLDEEQIRSNYETHRDTPSDINQHLPVLLDYYNRCNHVTEVGVRNCVSLWAALASTAKKVVAIDIKSVATPIVEKLTFVCGDIRKIDIEETDFLFIDTFHTYSQLYVELTRHENKARKFIGMHDTHTFGDYGEDGSRPALLQAIADFRAQNPHWILDYQTGDNNGLSILKRRPVRILILVLSFTDAPYGEMMEAQKRTWDSIEVSGVSTIYYHGGSETKLEGTELTLNCSDAYDMIHWKLKLALDHIWGLEWDYVFRTNSSSYIDKERLLKFTEELPRTKCYCGISGGDYASGSGVFLSRDCVAILRHEFKSDPVSYDDVHMGHCLSRHGIGVTPGAQRSDYYHGDSNKDIETYHYRCKPQCGDRNRDIEAFDYLFNKKRHDRK